MFLMLQEMELSSSKLKKLVIFQEGSLKTNQNYALKKFLDLLTFLQFYSRKFKCYVIQKNESERTNKASIKFRESGY